MQLTGTRDAPSPTLLFIIHSFPAHFPPRLSTVASAQRETLAFRVVVLCLALELRSGVIARAILSPLPPKTTEYGAQRRLYVP